MAFRNSIPLGATAPLHDSTSRKQNPGDIPSTAALEVNISVATDDLTGDADTERASSATRDAVANPVDTQDGPLPGTSSDPTAGHDGQSGSEPAPESVAASAAQLSNDSDCSPEEEANARIIYSFQSQASNELGVEAGEMVDVVEKESHGWWLVRNKQGALGWVPASFVQELQRGRRSRQKGEGLKGLA